MSSPAMESFLARLLTDQVFREAFLTDPAQAGREASLAESEIASLAEFDKAGLVLAAESLALRHDRPRSPDSPSARKAIGQRFGARTPLAASLRSPLAELLYLWELFLFKGCKRYEMRAHSLEDKGDHFRCMIELRDSRENRTAQGMAEGKTRNAAILRALAEAYERLCLPGALSKTFPFGSGVALTRKTALCRATGEYFERLWLNDAAIVDAIRAGEAWTKAAVFSGFRAWACIRRDATGMTGSGYGLSRAEALDSAERSLIRKRAYPQEDPRFQMPSNQPRIICCTPKEGAWLECWLIGH